MTWPPGKPRCKRDSNPGSSALEADALTTRPTRRYQGSGGWSRSVERVPHCGAPCVKHCWRVCVKSKNTDSSIVMSSVLSFQMSTSLLLVAVLQVYFQHWAWFLGSVIPLLLTSCMLSWNWQRYVWTPPPPPPPLHLPLPKPKQSHYLEKPTVCGWNKNS